MRRAAAQAIICSALMTHIFRPFYVPSDLKQAADSMLEFFDEDKDQQLVYRHLVSALGEDARMEADAISLAGDEICRDLDRLIPPTKIEDFRRDVDLFLHQTAQIWATQCQTMVELIEVTTPASDDEELVSYPEFGARNNAKAVGGSHSIAATFFPRITVNGKILHSGTVLWSDSPATMIAREQVPSPTLGRNGTLRKNGRRNSIVGHTAA